MAAAAAIGALELASAGANAYELGRKYGPGAAKLANKALSAKGRRRAIADIKRFKQKKASTKIRHIKRTGKKAWKKAGEGIDDLKKLGHVAKKVGEVTGSETLTELGSGLDQAATEGAIQKAYLEQSLRDAKNSWNATMAEHNPPGGPQ